MKNNCHFTGCVDFYINYTSYLLVFIVTAVIRLALDARGSVAHLLRCKAVCQAGLYATSLMACWQSGITHLLWDVLAVAIMLGSCILPPSFLKGQRSLP
ncbi:hypothetical protein GDO78_015173 [Eleutherodactylus coqui]|uniref:Uncharacterized protein n=1 Tax=Eleutherodactylus coqui TaxID=57060 RepID=A0A8J6EE28_ELECQ|nr:hypothetical protein GDO78_015173 [Eleutherodactylus coqui]